MRRTRDKRWDTGTKRLQMKNLGKQYDLEDTMIPQFLQSAHKADPHRQQL